MLTNHSLILAKTNLSISFQFRSEALVFAPLPLLFLTSSLASPLLGCYICFSRTLKINLHCSYAHPCQGGLDTANDLSIPPLTRLE